MKAQYHPQFSNELIGYGWRSVQVGGWYAIPAACHPLSSCCLFSLWFSLFYIVPWISIHVRVCCVKCFISLARNIQSQEIWEGGKQLHGWTLMVFFPRSLKWRLLLEEWSHISFFFQSQFLFREKGQLLTNWHWGILYLVVHNRLYTQILGKL
jgi:hypothetical protein